ncbi:MAG TPA: LytTR family DNA-binding domain-containing protein [Gemmatimonadaceae bacterium]|nr:LytTR family DNA-binding domain-containing protein [Gemmatimonadaceae bacterium]
MRDTRVLIVDDEPLARDVIRGLLGRFDDVSVVGECGNGRHAVEAIHELAPHIVFLDVQMPDLDGFGVLNALDHPPVVILVTAYDAFAVKAFDAEALDFLVKPFTDERFYQAFERARRLLTPAYRTRLLVSSGRRSLTVPIASVTWIAAEDYYARVHVGQTSHLLRETLTALEQDLDPNAFVRIHRSALVNIASISELRRRSDGRYCVVLTDSTRLAVSERRRGAVLKALGARRPG